MRLIDVRPRLEFSAIDRDWFLPSPVATIRGGHQSSQGLSASSGNDKTAIVSTRFFINYPLRTDFVRRIYSGAPILYRELSQTKYGSGKRKRIVSVMTKYDIQRRVSLAVKANLIVRAYSHSDLHL